MPEGSYRLALSREQKIPSETEAPVSIPAGDSLVRGELIDRSNTRLLGIALAPAAAVAGFLIPSSLFQEESCSDITDHCTKSPSTTGYVVGGAVLVGGLIASYSLASTKDGVSISVSPSAPP